jgi:DNA-binding transcriptional LysR family regulator
MINEIPGDLVQWLRGFYFVAERGGVRLAAAAMGREQPTITRQIKCLERELGVTLFDRSSGKMKITPEGKILLEKAVSLFEDVKGTSSGSKNSGMKERLSSPQPMRLSTPFCRGISGNSESSIPW